MSDRLHELSQDLDGTEMGKESQEAADMLVDLQSALELVRDMTK